MNGRPCGDGSTSRDYTYVGDIVAGVERALAWACGKGARYDIFNLGESRPVELSRLVEIIEAATGEKAVIDRLPLQAGDVERTFADIAKSATVLGYQPGTTIEDGIRAFVRWFRENN